MSRPPIWIPAHQRRPPARPETFYTIHAELDEAYQRDQMAEEIKERLAEELDMALMEWVAR